MLFANQNALMVDDLKNHAQQMALDASRFNACLDSSKYAARVQEGLNAGTALGVSSTPTLFVNGSVYRGSYDVDTLVEVLSR